MTTTSPIEHNKNKPHPREFFIDTPDYVKGRFNGARIKCTVAPSIDRLVAFERVSWPPEEQASSAELSRRLAAYPDGVFLFSIIESDGRETDIGQITGSPKNITNPDAINSFAAMAEQDVDPNARTFWFTNMALHPDFRGNRLAPLFMAEAIRQVESSGFESVMAGVTCDGFHEAKETNRVSDIHEFAEEMNPMLQTFDRAVRILNAQRDKETVYMTNSDPIANYWPENLTSEGYGVLVWIDLLNNQDHGSAEADCAMIPRKSRASYAESEDLRAIHAYQVDLNQDGLKDEIPFDKDTSYARQEETFPDIINRIATEYGLEKSQVPKDFEYFDWGRMVRYAAYTKWDTYYALEGRDSLAIEQALIELSGLYFKIATPMFRDKFHPLHFMQSKAQGDSSTADYIALEAVDGARAIASQMLIQETNQSCEGKTQNELRQMLADITSRSQINKRQFAIAYEAYAKEMLDESQILPTGFVSAPLETWISRYERTVQTQLETVRKHLEKSVLDVQLPMVLRGDTQQDNIKGENQLEVCYTYKPGDVTKFTYDDGPSDDTIRQTKTGREDLLMAALPQTGCPYPCEFCSVRHAVMGNLPIASQEEAAALGVKIGDLIKDYRAVLTPAKRLITVIHTDNKEETITLSDKQIEEFNLALAKQYLDDLGTMLITEGPRTTDTMVIFNGGNPLSPTEIPQEFWDMVPAWVKQFPNLKNIETEMRIDYLIPGKNGETPMWKQRIVDRMIRLQNELQKQGKRLRIRLAFEYVSAEALHISHKGNVYDPMSTDDELVKANMNAIEVLKDHGIEYLGYAMLGGMLSKKDSEESMTEDCRLLSREWPLTTSLFALENGSREIIVNTQYVDPIDQDKILKGEKDYYLPGAQDMSILIRETVNYLRTLTDVPEERGRLRLITDAEELFEGTIGSPVPEEFRQLALEFNNAPDQVAFYDEHRGSLERFDCDDYKGVRASEYITSVRPSSGQ